MPMNLAPTPDLAGPVRYPKIKVQLTGKDGNAFFVLGQVRTALRNAFVSQDEREAFMTEATKGDYNDLLATCMKWVDVR